MGYPKELQPYFDLLLPMLAAKKAIAVRDVPKARDCLMAAQDARHAIPSEDIRVEVRTLAGAMLAALNGDDGDALAGCRRQWTTLIQRVQAVALEGVIEPEGWWTIKRAVEFLASKPGWTEAAAQSKLYRYRDDKDRSIQKGKKWNPSKVADIAEGIL